MNSIGTLVGVRFVGAQKPLVHALGLNAAVFLNECLYWQVKVGEDGWFSRTIPQFTDDTGLSKSEQATVRTQLIKLGLIEERKGVQYRTQTRVNIDAFNEFLTKLQPKETGRLDGSAAQNQSASRSKSVGSYNRERTDNSKELEGNDDSAISPDGSGSTIKINPYGYWTAFCAAKGIDPSHLEGPQLGFQLNTAKFIIKDGISAGEVHDCTVWLQSQEWWRNKGITLADVRKQYSRWIGLGKPPAEKAVGSKQIRGATPRI